MRSVVLLPPRLGSLRLKLPEVPMLTLPEYIELPVPVLISSSGSSTAPVLASMNECSTDGVWSALTPLVTTS